jgi:GT2 family glycosyltransferase
MITVVVPARNAAPFLGECLDALLAQDPRPDEIIVVDDGSTDATAAVARARGVQVEQLPSARGPGGARNAGVARAAGAVVAFVDADDVVAPGWCAALGEVFASGAEAASSRLHRPTTGSLPQRFAAHQTGRATDRASSGLATSGTQLAVRRDVFQSVGGFDERLICQEDIDLSLRLNLAGHHLVVVDDAVVTRRERATVRGMLRQQARWAYWWPVLEWKWHHHHFAVVRRRIRPSPMLFLARAAMAATRGHVDPLVHNLFRAATEITWRTARLAGRAGLVAGARPVPTPVPPPASRRDLLPRLPDGPAAVLVGDRGAVRLLARGLRAGSRLASPPPGLLAVAPWDDPPPWPRRLVREARRLGWRLEPDSAARRLEWESPATYGEAVVLLHRVFAWLHAKPGFVLAAAGPAATDAARHTGAPVVAVADRMWPGAALVIEPETLRRRPADAARRICAALDAGDTARVADGLRLARLTPWAR